EMKNVLVFGFQTGCSSPPPATWPGIVMWLATIAPVEALTIVPNAGESALLATNTRPGPGATAISSTRKVPPVLIGANSGVGVDGVVTLNVRNTLPPSPANSVWCVVSTTTPSGPEIDVVANWPANPVARAISVLVSVETISTAAFDRSAT